jgi:hypothetical protein
MSLTDTFVSFLVTAKRNTYASGIKPELSSRPASHDLTFSEGDYLYIDTYLGGFHFIGEEAVWHKGIPIWGMNYYGKMIGEKIPDGFGEFLKEALMLVPAETPYRGLKDYKNGNFKYHCESSGSLAQFQGFEEIRFSKQLVYRLVFHGGEIKE